MASAATRSNGLTATFVNSAMKPGKYHDGKGTGRFHLVKPTGGRFWVQRLTMRGRRRELGLGSPPVVSLVESGGADLPTQKDAGASIADDDKPSDILRLSSWCLTGVLASISAPIAVSMAAVNLIRGEDFRLNTQVLVFTFAIVALNASNALADVAGALGM